MGRDTGRDVSSQYASVHILIFTLMTYEGATGVPVCLVSSEALNEYLAYSPASSLLELF